MLGRPNRGGFGFFVVLFIKTYVVKVLIECVFCILWWLLD